jgi:hypothetical protein
MPELEEKKDQVTYARFDANETTDADYSLGEFAAYSRAKAGIS